MKTDPTLTQDLERIRAVLARCHAARHALHVHRAQRPALQTALAAALIEDFTTARNAGNLSAPPTASLTAKQLAADRHGRMDTELQAECDAAEAERKAEVYSLQHIVLQHGHDITLALADELNEAAKPLIAAMQRASIIASAGRLNHVYRTLLEYHLPDLAAPAAPLCRDGRVKAADGSTLPLPTTGLDAALLDAIRAPRALLAELESFDPAARVDVAGIDATPSPPPATPSTPTVPAVVASRPQRGRGAGVAQRLA